MNIKTLSLVLFSLFVNSISAQSIFEKWPEMNVFHEVISETFHPTEENNLEPLKTRSEELMKKAENLLNSNIPEEYRTKAILSSLENLQLKSETLHKLVTSKASDTELKKSITDVHDVFHEIVGLCNENEK
ncbi:MAG: hypothetical protein IPO23_05215 [Flavobacterium sp.]|nr:hypothetical protein [Flavobacterium sp.]